jgi:hypothetical protein
MARTPLTSPNPYTFTVSDNVNLASVDSNWTNQDGVAGYVGVLSNRIYSAYGATSDAHWYSGFFSNDQYATIKLIVTATDTSDKIGVSVRNNAASYAARSMYRAYWWDPAGGGTNGSVVVEKIVSGGAPSTLATISSINAVTNDTLTLECVTSGSDAVLRVYLNSTQIDSGITDSSSPLTSGRPGIVAHGGSNAVFGDDWVGGDVTADSSPQFARPDADITDADWLPSTGSDLYAVLDESAADDGDYIYTSTDNSEFEVQLSSVSDPGVSTDHYLRIRVANIPSGKSLTTTLMQGASQIAQWVEAGPLSGTLEYELGTDADAITDYTDLRVRGKVS